MNITSNQRFLNIKNTTVAPTNLITIVSAYLVLVLNFPLLSKAFKAITESPDYSVLFLLSVPLVFICLFSIIIGCIAHGFLLKPVLIGLILISSMLTYATFSYGIVFDYSMVQNIVETDNSEAMSYLNLYALGFILISGVIPSLLIGLTKVKKLSVKTNIIATGKMLFSCTATLAILLMAYFANYAAVGRNNHDLVQYITPFKLFDASYKYVSHHYFSAPRNFEILDNSPQLITTDTTPSITVLVLGETARAMSFSLNGYNKDTNRFTKNTGIQSFTDVSSCGTATAVSVPCMFSRLSRKTYDKQVATTQQNVIDIAQLAGVDVLWIDNNNGSCKGVCKRVTTIEIKPQSDQKYCDDEYCFDEALLAPLDTKLSNITHQHTLIVLHMMGSHGPTYFRRYPADKKVFSPDCPRSDIQHCTRQALTNTYDNTIAYTDYVISEVIARLRTAEEQAPMRTSMMYISDHGESLGEKGAYLHGLPYAFAPKEQTQVPWLFWQSSALSHDSQTCLQLQTTKPASHDNVFDTLLGNLSVQSSAYQAENDLLSTCRHIENLAAVTNSNPPIEHTIGSTE